MQAQLARDAAEYEREQAKKAEAAARLRAHYEYVQEQAQEHKADEASEQRSVLRSGSAQYELGRQYELGLGQIASPSSHLPGRYP